MKEIEIIIHKFGNIFSHELSNSEHNKLNQKITFQYTSQTTLLEFFQYLNYIYKDIILKYENIDITKLNEKKLIRNRYRILNNTNSIYIYDLNTKLSLLIELFKLEKIEIIFSFFIYIGGKLLELKGMQFYMYSKEQGKHNLPHIHVKYKNQEVVISLDGQILVGEIKGKMQKLAIDVITSDKESFLLKWNTLTDGGKFYFSNSELIRINEI